MRCTNIMSSNVFTLRDATKVSLELCSTFEEDVHRSDDDDKEEEDNDVMIVVFVVVVKATHNASFSSQNEDFFFVSRDRIN